MRVFVTGASGWVGSAIVKDLLAAGHSVLGLARSDTSAAVVAAAGADVHRGTIEDLDSLRAGTQGVDGVIHTAFSHDFSKFVENGIAEKAAIEALGTALAGSGRPLVVTSGVAFMPASGGPATEDDTVPPGNPVPRNPEAPAFAATGSTPGRRRTGPMPRRSTGWRSKRASRGRGTMRWPKRGWCSATSRRPSAGASACRW